MDISAYGILWHETRFNHIVCSGMGYRNCIVGGADMTTVLIGLAITAMIVVVSVTITTGIAWYEHGMDQLIDKYKRK